LLDDVEKARALVEQIQANLPILVYPGTPLLRSLEQQGINIKPKHPLHIENVFYMGDEGGIMCDISGIPKKKERFLVSITHIRVKETHPLADAIQNYQLERLSRLV